MKTHLYATILTLFAILPAWGQINLNNRFKNLTLQSGLSDNKVNVIHQDSNGFVWFGTDYGLSRYDGVSVKNFTLNGPHNFVGSIVRLKEHTLCVQIGQQFYTFSQVTEQFLPIRMPMAEKEVLGIQPISGKNCWVVGRQSIHYCEIVAGSPTVIRSVSEIVPDRLSASPATGYTFSSDGSTLYLTTAKSELIAFDLNARKMKQCFHITDELLSVHTLLDFKDYVWIGTLAKGIFRINKKTGSTEHFSYEHTEKEHQLSHTDVFEIVPVDDGQLMAVTWNGFTLLTAHDNSFYRFHTTIYNNVSLPWQDIDVRMMCAYYDKAENGVWIGTYGGGAIYIDLKQSHIHKYRQESHNETRGITTDRNGMVWIATFHKGLMRSTHPFPATGHDDENLSFTAEKEMKHSAPILCMHNDTATNTLWLGDREGNLYTYNCDKHRCSTVRFAEDTAIWSLYIDSKRRIWIGCGNGLFLYEPSTKQRTRYAIENEQSARYAISTIAESHDGQLWVGIENRGLGKVMPNQTIRTGYGKEHQLDHTTALSIHATTDQKLYIGYANGLVLMNLKDERITERYTTQNGLYNNYISCILEDADHQIWVGSNSCISKFDPENKLFFHYLVSSNNKSAYAYRQFIFWGNNKSITYFNPRLVDVKPTERQVVISSLEIDNHPVDIGDTIHGQVVLKGNVFYADKIKLNDKNRNFSLSFSSLSNSSQHPKIRYRLYPYQKEWIIVDKEGDRVNYNNLKAGNYRFEMQAIYPGGTMGKTSRLDIHLTPHWSETLWFKILLFVAPALFILMLVHHFKNQQRHLRHELQLEHENFTIRMERDKEQQIHRERENFFTNTAHELRTPLTLIISPIQDLLNRLPQEDKLHAPIEMVYKNCRSLHTLIDHLLYVQKIGTGMVHLEVTQTDINTLVRSVGESFCQLAATKQIDYRIDIPRQAYPLWVDENKIASAIQNLLSNAFKYTDNRGQIMLCIDRTETDGNHQCRIMVTDNGQGIPEAYQQRIFDSFITAPNTPTLSSTIGIGLHIVKNTVDLHHGRISLNSTEGKGSIFTILLPEGKEHFEDDKQVHIQEDPADNTAEPIDPAEHRDSLLVIEDNRDIRQYICSLFSQEYTVYEAENGEEGVRTAQQKVPTLIISDIMMPVKDGFECCKEIRETPRTAHIPIIMLTAKAEDIDLLTANQLGVDDYITKPFNPQVLASKVKSLIKQRNRLKRIYTQTLMLSQHDNNESTSNGKNEFLESVIQVIEANLSNEDFNVKMMAEQLNISQPTLYRKLKEVSKLSAIDMIRSMRMSKVATLIMEKKYTIQEIAEKVGYNDPRTLRKHFANQFGITPSQFIERESEERKTDNNQPIR